MDPEHCLKLQRALPEPLLVFRFFGFRQLFPFRGRNFHPLVRFHIREMFQPI
jgi:hypothetical protein